MVEEGYKVALFMEHPQIFELSNVENNDDTSGVKNPTQNQAFKKANSGNPVSTLFFCPLFFYFFLKKGHGIKKKKIVQGKLEIIPKVRKNTGPEPLSLVIHRVRFIF
jgi:hypothetical protein